MTLLEFLKLTWEWLVTEYEGGVLDDALQQMRTGIRLTREKARQWWDWAKILALSCIITSLAVFLTGIIMGVLLEAGWPNALAGLLIAPVLFVLLLWWTPLVAIIAVVSEIAHLRFKNAAGVAVAKAKWWLGITCGVLLWQVITSLAFTFIPYWNAPSRIPVMMLLGLAMALIGIKWGGGQKHRKVIKVLVVVTFITQVAVCFFPHTATAINGWAGKADKDTAKSIDTNGLLPAAKKTTAPPPRDISWTRWEVKSTTNTVVRVFNGDEFIYKSPAAFKVLWEGSPDQQYHNPSATPEDVRSFKFYDVPTGGQKIKLLPIDGTNVFWLEFRIESRRTS